MRRVIGACLVLLVLYSGRINAQTGTPEGDDLPENATGTLFTESSVSPSVYILSSAAILTAITLRYDQPIADEIISWKESNRTVGALSPIITEMGTGGFAAGLLGSFAAYGYLFDDERALEVGKLGAVSFAATGLAVQLVKHLSGRERPETATRPGGFWSGPFAAYRKGADKSKGIGSYDAFASGHTTTAFAVATVFADVYEDEPWVGYVSYSMASLVAISRVTERTHWVSDCIVGAMIGIYGTKIVEDLMRVSPSLSVSPLFFDNEYGLLLSMGL